MKPDTVKFVEMDQMMTLSEQLEENVGPVILIKSEPKSIETLLNI
jgi:hypothetical protein